MRDHDENYIEPVAMRSVLFEGMVSLVAGHQRHYQLPQLLFIRLVSAVVQFEQESLQRELLNRLEHRRRASTSAHQRVSTVISDRGDRDSGLVRHIFSSLATRIDFLDGPGELVHRPAALTRLLLFGEVEHDGRRGNGGLSDLYRAIHEGRSGCGRHGTQRHVLI